MPPVLSFVGKSGSGKTTLLERLIGELARRGYRIATVKHGIHGFDLDQPGKDSWRLAQAGSEAVALSSPEKLAIIRQVDHDPSLEEISSLIGDDFHLLLTEGFKRDTFPKIEVHRKELGELLCSPEELLAVVTDEPLEISIPQYSFNDTQGIVNFLEEILPSLRGVKDVALFVNNRPVPINPFVSSYISSTLLGMVSALSGVEEVKSLKIWLNKG